MNTTRSVLIAMSLGIGYRYILDIFFDAPIYFCVSIGSIIVLLTLIYYKEV